MVDTNSSIVYMKQSTIQFDFLCLRVIEHSLTLVSHCHSFVFRSTIDIYMQSASIHYYVHLSNMMLCRQRTLFFATLVMCALFARQESGVMVSAEEKADKEDKEDDIMDPVEINVMDASAPPSDSPSIVLATETWTALATRTSFPAATPPTRKPAFARTETSSVRTLQSARLCHPLRLLWTNPPPPIRSLSSLVPRPRAR
jgi:hypothetical protein